MIFTMSEAEYLLGCEEYQGRCAFSGEIDI